MTRYYWEDRTTCDIDIGWETWCVKGNNTVHYDLHTDVFRTEDKITVQVLSINLNTSGLTLDDITHYQILDENGELLPVGNTDYHPYFKIRISGIDNTISKLPISFGFLFNDNETIYIVDPSAGAENIFDNQHYISSLEYIVATNVTQENYNDGEYYYKNNEDEYIHIEAGASEPSYNAGIIYYFQRIIYTAVGSTPYRSVTVNSDNYNNYYILIDVYTLASNVTAESFENPEHIYYIKNNQDEYEQINAYDENISEYYTYSQDYIHPLNYDENYNYQDNINRDYYDIITYDENTTYYTIKTYAENEPIPTVQYLVNYKQNKNDETIFELNKFINILKPSRYDNNVIFNKDGLNEFVKNIKNYPIIQVDEITDVDIWSDYTQGKPCLKVIYGDTTKEFSGYKKADGSNQANKTTGFQYVPVGSNIKFLEVDGAPKEPLSTVDADDISTWHTGTFRVKVNSDTFEVPIMGLAGGSGAIELGGDTIIDGDLFPTQDDNYNIGLMDYYELATEYTENTIYYVQGNNLLYTVAEPQPTAGNFNEGTYYIKNPRRWKNLYITGDIGASSDPINAIYVNNIGASSALVNAIYVNNINTPSGSSLSMTGPLNITSTAGYTGAAEKPTDANGSYGVNAISCAGGAYFAKNLSAMRVYNAVFNDYAECRTTIDLTPGHVVIDNDDGSLSCSNARLQPGAQVISDTYGHLMGSTDTATTPIAVAGRVLVYTYQSRENYHAGMAVCSAPDGTVDIMTREEIRDYPDCIIGIVSEIPQYDVWGSDNVKVDGRIWIKVK